jgi:hypothetical protein
MENGTRRLFIASLSIPAVVLFLVFLTVVSILLLVAVNILFGTSYGAPSSWVFYWILILLSFGVVNYLSLCVHEFYTLKHKK